MERDEKPEHISVARRARRQINYYRRRQVLSRLSGGGSAAGTVARKSTFRGSPHTWARVNQTRTRPGMLYGHRNIAMLYGGPRLNLIYISALLHRGKCEERAGR